MWRASWSRLSGPARLCAALAVLLALCGCNVSIEEDVLADLPGQAPAAATFELKSYRMDGKDNPMPAAATVLRFVAMPNGQAIAELYNSEKDKSPSVAATVARLLLLGDGWFVLSMREIALHGSISYALVRFSGRDMLVIPTAQGKALEAYRTLGLEVTNAAFSGPVDPLALTTAFRAITTAYARDPLPFMTLAFAKIDAMPAQWDEARATGLLKLRETITHEYPRLTREEKTLFRTYLDQFSAGSPAANYLLGLIHYFDWELDGAQRHATRAVEAGMASAKVVLAMTAQRRREPDADVHSVSLYTQAAETGDPIAMARLAQQQQDLPMRIGWLQKSAEAGSAEARKLLAGAYFLGEGVPRSPENARKLLEAAAAQGEPEALHQLSEYMRAGHGGAKDEAGANRTLWKAARRGLPAAQAELGQRLFKGEALPADTVESLYWLGSAIGKRNSAAIRHLAGIEATMNHPEVLSHATLQLLFSEKMLQAAADKEIAAWCGVGLFAGETEAMTKMRANCSTEVAVVHKALADTYRSGEATDVLLDCIDVETIAMPSPQSDILECHDEMQFE